MTDKIEDYVVPTRIPDLLKVLAEQRSEMPKYRLVGVHAGTSVTSTSGHPAISRPFLDRIPENTYRVGDYRTFHGLVRGGDYGHAHRYESGTAIVLIEGDAE